MKRRSKIDHNSTSNSGIGIKGCGIDGFFNSGFRGRTNQSLVERLMGEALSEKSEKALKPIEHKESCGFAVDLLPDLSTILMY
jgi:hypothetical protein